MCLSDEAYPDTKDYCHNVILDYFKPVDAIRILNLSKFPTLPAAIVCLSVRVRACTRTHVDGRLHCDSESRKESDC